MRQQAQVQGRKCLDLVVKDPSGCNLGVWDHLAMTDEEQARVDAALKELVKLSAAYEAAERALDKRRDALHSAIVKHLMDRTLKPGEVEKNTPYDRNHIRRIAQAAGVPPLRERTVRSAKEDA